MLRDWSRGFVDRDGKFVKEFQATFESSLWELYVHAYIRELGGVVDFDRPAAQLAHNGPIISALYGLYFDEEQSIAPRSSRVIRYPLSTVSKSDSVDLPVGFFRDERYAHVSAVINSPIAGMGKIRALAQDPVDQLMFTAISLNPESIEPRVRKVPKSDYTEILLDGLYVIHNPHARHPLDFDTLARERIAQLTLSETGKLLGTGPDDFLQVRFVFSLATR